MSGSWPKSLSAATGYIGVNTGAYTPPGFPVHFIFPARPSYTNGFCARLDYWRCKRVIYHAYKSSAKVASGLPHWAQRLCGHAAVPVSSQYRRGGPILDV